MKITLDLPDDTIGGSFVALRSRGNGVLLHTRPIASDEMKDGAVIELRAKTDDD